MERMNISKYLNHLYMGVERRPGLNPNALLAALTILVSTSFMGGCNREGDTEISSGITIFDSATTNGLRIRAVQGNNQTTAAGSLFPSQLIAQVFDSATGFPVAGTQVVFSETTSTNSIIIPQNFTSDIFGNKVNVTDSAGQVAAKVQAPRISNQLITIVAKIYKGSDNGLVEFTLNTKNTVPAKIALTTSHGQIETAGTPFDFTVSLNDEFGNLVDTYNGPLYLTWSNITHDSWAWDGTDLTGTTLASGEHAYSLPQGTSLCNFTNGICNTNTLINSPDPSNPNFLQGCGPLGCIATDSSQPSLISVRGNGIASTYAPIFNLPITVIGGVAAKTVFADKPGGPSGADAKLGSTNSDTEKSYMIDNAVAYSNPSTIVKSADASQGTIYAALADKYGNFVKDSDASLQWSPIAYTTGSGTNIASTALITYPTAANTTVSVNTITITPTATGTSTISATTSAGSGFLTYIVDPGAMFKVLVSTQHAQIETAGKPFNLNMSVVDKKGNILVAHHDGSAAFLGTLSATASILDGSSDPQISMGCNRLSIKGDNTFNAPFSSSPINLSPSPSNAAVALGSTSGCGARTYTPIFSNGISDTTLTASLNYASSNHSISPKISITLNTLPAAYSGAPYNTAAYNTGTTPIITVNKGTPSRLELHTTGVDDGSFILDQYSVENGANYWTDLVGAAIPKVGSTPAQASRVFYSILTDSAGNYLSNPADTTWTFGSAQEFVLSTPPVGASATYTPKGVGYRTLVLRSVSANGGLGVLSSYNALTNYPDHFEIYITDGGTSSPNSSSTATQPIDVTQPLTLHIEAKDDQNNTARLTESVYLTAYTSGTITASPKGTSPILPLSGPVAFTDGQALVPIRIPNLLNTAIKIGMALTDIAGAAHCTTPAGVHTASYCSNSGVPINFLTPVLKAGAISAIFIKDQANGAGNSLNGTTPLTALTTDSLPTYSIGAKDSEQNVIPTTSVGSGTWTSSTLATGPVAAIITAVGTGSNVTLSPTHPGTGILTVSLGSMTPVSTGLITVGLGVLDHVTALTQQQYAAAPASTSAIETAGVPFALTVQLFDKKDNLLTTDGTTHAVTYVVNGSTSATIYGQTYSKPSNGTLAFVGGVLTTENFTFYNSNPALNADRNIQVTVTGKSASSSPISIVNGAINHLRLKAAATTVIAGQNMTYTITGVDQWGNTTLGTDASKSITFSISSSLTGQDINATTLGSPTNVAGASDTSVTGTLASGVATATGSATQTGTLTVAGAGSGGPLPGSPSAGDVDSVTVLPDPVVASMAWNSAPTSPYLASNSTAMTNFSAKTIDKFSNVITNNGTSTVSLSLTAGNSSLLGGTLTKTCSAGVVTFNNITYPKIETITLQATENSQNKATPTQDVTVQLGAAARVIVVGPGQTHNPGSTSFVNAVTGSIPNQTSGTPFTITMHAVDEGYNTVTSYSPASAITYTTTDPSITSPTPENFASGVKTFSITPLTAYKNLTITPTTSLIPITSTFYQVNPGPATQVVLVLPGQGNAITEATGSTPGPISTIAGPGILQGATSFANALLPPSPSLSTDGFNVVAYATDANFNVVTTDTTTQVTLVNDTANDPNATGAGTNTLSGGLTTFPVQYHLAKTGYVITASNGAGLTARSTSSFNVKAGTVTQTAVVLPGQTLVGGQTVLASAVTGTPTPQTAGTPFTANVYALDQYFNRSLTYTSAASSISLSAPDSHSSAPTNSNFTSALAAFSVTNNIASSGFTLTAGGTPISNLNNNSSSGYAVSANVATQIVPVLTDLGQSLNQGWPSGQIANAITPTSPSSKAAGAPFNVDLYVVDAYYNKVTTDNSSSIGITTDDANDTDPAAATLTAGTKQFVVTNVTAGTRSLIASAGTYTKVQSNNYTITPAALHHTLTLIGGETFSGGSLTGKTGSPSATFTTDSTIPVTIRAVDLYNNTVTSHGGPVSAHLNDPSSEYVNPATPTQFTAGMASFSIAPITATTGLTVTPAGTGITQAASASFNVAAGVAAKTIVLVGNQTYHPGCLTFACAVTGAVPTQTAGSSFSITAIKTDSKFNQITTNAAVSFTTTDAVATMPSGNFANGSVTFTNGVTLVQSNAANQTTTITPFGAGGVASGGITVLHNTPHNAYVLPPGVTLLKGQTAGTTLGSPSPQTAGISFTTTVNAVDDWNNIANSANGATPYTDAVSISLSAKTSDESDPTASTFDNGAKTFDTTFYGAGATRALTLATPLSNTGFPGITVNPGLADHVILIQGDAQNAVVNQAVAINPKIQVVDQWSNPKPNSSLTFTVSSGGGSVNSASSATANSDANGLASVTYAVGTVTGTNNNTLTAGNNTLPALATSSVKTVTFTESALPGPLGQVALTAQPTNSIAGVAISPNIQAALRDQYGNVLTSSSGTVVMSISTNPNGGVLLGTTTVAAVNGIASFGDLNIRQAGNNYTLKATSGDYNKTSDSFNITPGAVSLGSISGTSPASANGSSGSTVTITLTDAYGNPVQSQTPTFSATDTQTRNSSPGCGPTNSFGISTCTLNSTYPETKTLTITAPTVTSSTSTVIFNGIQFSSGDATIPNDSYPGVPDASSITHTYTITNISGVPIPMNSISTSISGAGYSLGTDNCTNTPLAVGADCTVQVNFTGSTTGTYTGNFSVSATPGGTLSNNLLGTSP